MTRALAKRKRSNSTLASTIRVAAYLRQSVSDDLEFNSLDAQHEAIRSYVASQKAEGWILLPEDYRDSGFSGGTIDRPAFARLLEDARSGKIDIVIVHRIDRLSRSLSDFSRIIELFQEQDVSLVSVTQQFNTASSMGQLTLNILMSFAQFERQMIAERTRDKMGATRRRGQWTGGRPVLGYDLVDKRLVIHTTESEQVREISRLYLDYRSLIAVAAEANRRGWKTKSHTTKVGKVLQSRPFDKHAVRRILSHPIYLGKVHYDGQLYAGEHEAIVEEDTWNAVQRLLKQNGANRNGNGSCNGNAILRGLVRCGACGSAMTPN